MQQQRGSFEVQEVARGSSGESAWQQYVAQSGKASLYHDLAWRDILVDSFGHRDRYLMAVSGGQTRGVLPLIEMRSRMFGHFLVSLPFVNYGGVVADDGAAEAALAEGAAALAGNGASHIELRQDREGASGWVLRQHKASLTMRLDVGEKAIWDGISSRLRGKVRKAEKNGVTFAITDASGVDDFYSVYSRNMRDLGTPVYSINFFRNVLRLWPSTILLARRNGNPVAAAIAVHGKDGTRLELPWICMDYRESSNNVNEFLYWSMIAWACKQPARELDLGRSSVGAGTYKFKMQWNPEVRPLFWYYFTPQGNDLPHLHPDNPKYALAVRCWQKLPLAIANRLGPGIVRNIP
jgi:serine/alanine adding enzyme